VRRAREGIQHALWLVAVLALWAGCWIGAFYTTRWAFGRLGWDPLWGQ
jgi:hypothetical protein